MLLTGSRKSIYFMLLLLIEDKDVAARLTSVVVVLFVALIEDLAVQA